MPTKKQLEEMLANGEFDPDDDDNDEVEYGFGDGSYVRGSYRRVSEAAAARGHKLRADPPAEPKDGEKTNVRPAHFGGTRAKRTS